MRNLAILTTLILAASLAGCSITPTDYSRSGGYVGGSLSFAGEEFGDVDPTTGNDSDDAIGFSVRTGYRILPWGGIEFAYEQFDEFDVGSAEVDMQSLMLQGKVYPFTGRLQPYALGGIGYVRSDVDFDAPTVRDFDTSDFSWRLGGGLDLYLIDMLPLFAEVAYTWPTDDLDDLEFWTASVGAYFRF